MHLLLVDGSTYIFRAYHALPPLSRKSDGLPVGAVSGFCNMLYRLTLDFEAEELETPTHMAVIFDHSGKSFRNDFYPEYKAHRPPAPEDLVPQFPLTREATRAFSISSVEQEGFEADDLIATYARQAEAKGMNVTIVSSDKDLMQLVSDKISMLDTMKNRWIGADEVREKFGVGPDKVIDVQSLAGDSVDNVPGVPGIGIKTAAQLIEEYGGLDTLLERAGEIKQNKRRENLIEFADQARVSRDLVTLKVDVPVEVQLDEFARQPLDATSIIPFLKAMEFTTITKRVAAAIDADADAIEADTSLAPEPLPETESVAGAEGSNTPSALAEKVALELSGMPVEHEKYEIVRTLDALDKWIDAIKDKGYVAIDTETTGLDNQQADLVGVCLSTEVGNGCYVPLIHTSGEDDLLGGGLAPDQLPTKEVIEKLKPILEDQSILKIGQNMKYDMGLLMRYGIEMNPIDDTMLMSYATDGARNNGMDALSEKWLDHKPIKFTDLAGTGKKQKTFDQIPIEDAAKYAAEDADITLRLWKVLKPRLVAQKAVTLYETIERPLVPVLARMEARGIHVDRQILARLSGDFAQRAAGLEAEIHELAGEKFNVGSPKQLGEILFDKMGLPGGKKTKTGAWQTGAGVLEDLAAEGNDLAKAILEWRGLSKLKSTYTDALPEFINPNTGRVHTSYAQAAVATGRLSSSDPNLQNIPVRTEDGRKIRTAFVAEPGKKLISADYSQIELRVLAHIADIPELKKAFADGLDIHAMTASEMFGVPIEGMDPMVRRRAKAINFGIIYGISAFGLANQLGISRTEASDYIKTYFERFPGIKDYMEATKKFVHDKGYVATIFGRKAFFPEINTKNAGHRAFYERAAINAPIQGSAADIIRRAMIQMEGVLEAKKVPADMLLQVHDELIFEVPESEAEDAIPVISKVMIDAPMPAISLTVPLQVDARAADNWNDAH
ncbi:DNA polymerase I [Maritalea porphyrae]|uniref:DNA polymerase I n=1 Tax=Maritalea porphyrae TaxID=880732 RepID=A0ABQ5UR50_9HYPH|nr:DNA polymerase I [Maritalea porphyrae]GLQ17132.1 DNA polymerase I [Maritalea porphyrae]